MAKAFPFVDVVRKFLARSFPSWEIVHVLKGSGPVVTARRPGDPKRPHAAEDVAFQKYMGGSFARVYFWAKFLIPSAAGKRNFDTLRTVTLEPEHNTVDDAAALDAWLEAKKPILEKEAAKLFPRMAKGYAGFDLLLGRLDEHYSLWMTSEGRALDLGLFKEAESQAGSKIVIPAFERFRAWLKGRGLFEGVPPFDDTVIWRYWTEGRPMRREDYLKGDYYYCSRCEGFTAQGTLEERKDRRLGPHFVWLCPRCGRR